MISNSHPVDFQLLESTLVELCLLAGTAILKVRAGGLEVKNKDDLSPVTQADQQAEEIILAGLRRTFPDIPIIAEEEMSSGKKTKIGTVFFLVDPLDGTRDFISGADEFTVNIALIENGEPVVGCIYAPALSRLYYGANAAAYRSDVKDEVLIGPKVSLQARAHSPRKILASKLHLTKETRNFILEHPQAKAVHIGSSLKFCLMAQGDADLYPRFSPTMEWDIAAGDAILRCAGGMTRDLEGQPMVYGDKNPSTSRPFENGHFIASAS